MRRVSNWIILLLLGLFAMGCAIDQQAVELSDASNNVSAQDKSSTPTVTSTRTWKPTMTASPFRSSTPSKTSIPSSTPTPSEGMYAVVQANIQVRDSLPDDISLNGQLVISDKADLNPDHYTYYDFASDSKLDAFTEKIRANSVFVSPDGKWMFYSIEQVGEPQKVFYDFISEEIIYSQQPDDEDSLDRFIQDARVKKLYDDTFLPYREVRKQIDLGLPDFDYYQTSMFASMPVLDPSGTYIIYSTSTDLWTGFYSEYALYNLKTKTVLGHYLVHSLPDVGNPIWSHAGDQFFYIGVTDDANLSFNFVDKTGKLNRVAEIGQEISTYTVAMKIWSPDDQYVAVLVAGKSIKDRGVPKELFIVDIENQKVIKTGISVFGFMDTSIDMIWSPNSKQLVLENELEQYSNEVILLDLSTLQAGILLDNATFHGWVSIPEEKFRTMEVEATMRPTPTAITATDPLSMAPSFSGLTQALLQNEDLSQLKFANSIAEALSSDEYLVTRELVLSGALIREAKTREKDHFYYKSVEPAEVSVLSRHSQSEYVVSLNNYSGNPFMAPCRIISVYKLASNEAAEIDGEIVVMVQAWKTKQGIQYLQYVLPIDGDNYEEFDSAIIITPYLGNDTIREKTMTELANIADDQVPIDSIWVKYLQNYGRLFLDWMETGTIPDELSYYPLKPIIIR